MNGDTSTHFHCTDSCNSLERQGELLLQKMCMAMNKDANNNAAARSSFHLTRPPPSTKKYTSPEEVTIDDCSSEIPPKACSSGSASPSGTTRSLSSDDLTCHDFLTTERTGGHQVSSASIGSSTEPRPDALIRNDLSSSSILDLLLDNNDMISNDAERSSSSQKDTFPKDTSSIDPPKDQEQTVLQERLRQLGQSQQMQQLLLLQQLSQKQMPMSHQQQQQPTVGTGELQRCVRPSPAQLLLLQQLGQQQEPTSVKDERICSNSVQNNFSHVSRTNAVKTNSCQQHQVVSSYGMNKGSKSPRRRVRPPTKASLNLNQANTSPRDGKVTEKAARNAPFQYAKVVGGGFKRAFDQMPQPQCKLAKKELCSLLDYLDLILESRGYDTTKRSASDLGYVKVPTPLQLASFGTAIYSATKPGDADRLRSLLQCGLSPNPMNKFGDSPFFNVCRRGVTELVKVFIDCGAEVCLADSLGRTPLHYVAWANPPSFEAAKMILMVEPRLLCVMDKHGKTPLDFVPIGHASAWIDFIDTLKGSLWPANAMKGSLAPSKGQLPDPPKSLNIEMAKQVASGKVKPENL
ncbi:hypothetical protein ACHAWC_010506 [Mediolabrus comicus]